MDNTIKFFCNEKLFHPDSISKIDFMETEQGGLQQIQPGLLQIDIIIIVEIINPCHLMTVF
ncbi:Uncharacterised protein [Klebsiella oxytoca]|nr:Uncharacterised protein [Klebsiella oxytoca]SAQ34008.1 Uncharacterised protein [Klebsiella oxytoca]